MKVTVAGASDDLVEVGGDIYEEFNPRDPSEVSYLAFSDGTVLDIAYTTEGFWRIHAIRRGSAGCTIATGTDEDTDYTDTATLEGDRLDWVVFGSSWAQAK